MKIYTTSSFSQINSIILNFISENNWNLKQNESSFIRSQECTGLFKYKFNWEIHKIETGHKIRFYIKYTLLQNLLSYLLLLLLSFEFIYSILCLHIEIATFNSTIFYSCFALSLTLLYLLLYRPHQRQKKFNKLFHDFLGARSNVQVLEPFRLLDWCSMLNYYLIYGILLAFFSRMFHFSVLLGILLCLPFALSFGLQLITEIFQKKDGFFSKGIFLSIISLWISSIVFNFIIIVFIISLHSTSFCDTATFEEHPHKGPVEFKEHATKLFNEILFHHDNDSAIDAPRTWNINRITQDEIMGSFFIKYYIPFSFILVFFLIFYQLNRWPKILEKSTNKLIQSKLLYFGSLQSKASFNYVYHIYIMILWLIGITINYLQVALSFSIIYWIITDKIILFSQIIFKISWLKYYPQVYPSPIMYFVWYSLIVTLTIPTIVMLLNKTVSIYRVIADSYLRNRIQIDTEESKSLKLIVKQECDKDNIILPRIIFKESGKNLLYSKKSFFSKRAKIYIHIILLKKLKTDELRVAIRHELGHIKNDLQKLLFLKSLSSIGLFPFPILAIIIDFVKIELEADKFALKDKDSSQSLSSAIIKMKLLNEFNQTKHRNKISHTINNYLSNKFTGFRLLIVGTYIFSYNYPIDDIRLALIQEEIRKQNV